MTTETINGLHKCQPKNEPKIGDTKNLVVLHMPAKNGKKPWIKIKSEALDKGGSPYRILNVIPTGWEPDDYGNISFNLEVEALSASRNTLMEDETAGPGSGNPPAQYVNKDDYWERKLQHEISVQPKIIRQHSQAMALEVLKLKVTLNELTVEDLEPSKLKELADYFDNDVIGAQ